MPDARWQLLGWSSADSRVAHLLDIGEQHCATLGRECVECFQCHAAFLADVDEHLVPVIDAWTDGDFPLDYFAKHPLPAEVVERMMINFARATPLMELAVEMPPFAKGIVACLLATCPGIELVDGQPLQIATSPPETATWQQRLFVALSSPIPVRVTYLSSAFDVAVKTGAPRDVVRMLLAHRVHCASLHWPHSSRTTAFVNREIRRFRKYADEGPDPLVRRRGRGHGACEGV